MDIRTFSKQAGFQRGVGNTDVGFILLTKSTDGQAGRRIYINAALAAKLVAMVDESKRDLAIHQLSQLRGLAGGISSYTNVRDPSQHKTRCGDLEVTYFITQQVIGKYQPAVFITDIDLPLFGKGNLPGLYRVTKEEDDQWKLNTKESDSISTKNAALNGLAQDLIRAGTMIMPPMVEYAYGRSGDNKARLDSEGFTLFYNPQSIKTGNAEWRTPEQKQTNHKATAQKLADVLVKAQREGRKVQWTIHGNGSDLLGSALAMLPGQNLSVHELMFMSPGDLPKVLTQAQKAGMNLHGDTMKYSDAEASLAKFRNQTWNSSQVANAVRAFGASHAARADEIRAGGQAAKMALGTKSLVTLLSLGMTTAVQTALAQQNHGIRNTVAQLAGSTNPALNPHLNPHLSRAAFNQRAKTESGGLGASYRETFKELVKKIKG